MALSGSFTTNQITDYGLTTSFRFDWSATQSVANNTSTVTWTVTTIQSPTGSGYQRTIMSGSTVTVNGTNYTISSGQGAYNSLVIARGTTIINHNDDGSKTFSASVKVSLGSASSNSNVGSASFTLDVIARASTLSLNKSSLVINGTNSVVITVTKRNSAFTDSLSYNFNGTTGNLGSVANSLTWTPPVSLLSAIPNSTSGTCQIICQTYNGSTLVGTSQASITFSTDAVPTVSASIQNTTKHLDNTSYTDKWLRYVSTGTISGSASSPGATITSYRITNGTTELGTTLPLDVSNLTVNTIVVYATDSRGQTGSATISLTPWVDYIIPTVSIDKLERTSNITATSTVMATVSGTVTPSSSGLSVYCTLTCREVSAVVSTSSNTFTMLLNIGTFAREQSYTITATINDTFAEYTATATLKRAVPVIHMGNDYNNEGIPHFDVEGHLVIHGSDSKIIWIDDNGTSHEMTLSIFTSLLS